MQISYQLSTLQDFEIKQLGNVIILEEWSSHSNAIYCIVSCVAGHFPIADNCLRHIFEVLAKS